MPFDPGQIAIFLPFVALLIPIVAILTTHQRKMAELMIERQQTSNPEIAALRQEVAELKQLIHQQAIAVDNLAGLQTRTTPPDPLVQRLGGA